MAARPPRLMKKQARAAAADYKVDWSVDRKFEVEDALLFQTQILEEIKVGIKGGMNIPAAKEWALSQTEFNTHKKKVFLSLAQSCQNKLTAFYNFLDTKSKQHTSIIPLKDYRKQLEKEIKSSQQYMRENFLSDTEEGEEGAAAAAAAAHGSTAAAAPRGSIARARPAAAAGAGGDVPPPPPPPGNKKRKDTKATNTKAKRTRGDDGVAENAQKAFEHALNDLKDLDDLDDDDNGAHAQEDLASHLGLLSPPPLAAMAPPREQPAGTCSRGYICLFCLALISAFFALILPRKYTFDTTLWRQRKKAA